MRQNTNLINSILIFALFLLPSTPILAESSQQQGTTSEKQKVEKLESGRYNQQKSDADPRGKTPENKGNFDTNVPRGDGLENVPAVKSPKQPENVNPSTPSGTRY